MKKPFVGVMLATYNGGKWLEDQIQSILSQEKVNVNLFVADDCSCDATLEILKKYNKDGKIKFKINEKNLGPCLNFLKLIKDINIENLDYIALSDQDDIWHPDKLIHAIDIMSANRSDGYSSGFIVKRKNNNIKININTIQTKFDYVFESPGPGCTYVLTSDSVKEFKFFLLEKYETLNNIEFHDWFIYFWYRVNNKNWIIDGESKIDYRQHNNNYFGANIGLSKKIKRFKMMLNGWYINQIKEMILICRNENLDKDILKIDRLSVSKIFEISKNSRRNSFERPIVFAYILLHKFRIVG